MSITRFSPTVNDAGCSSSVCWPQPCRRFSFDEIQLATQNFDESLVIGRGGFGKVYKGTITNGTSRVVAAVKRLDSTSNQGATEFWAEVEMLSKLRHCNLVSLIGYCNDGQEMILVYEYMPHGTLEDHLHKLHTPISWVRQLKICIGAARGLDYLHSGTGIKHGVIHHDVKSSNILLGRSWAAKVSDFGLSKICPTNQPSTHVSTSVKGSFGYLDPAYYSTGRLTRKSDVYAFGVVLFELLCQKRAEYTSPDEGQWGLATWAQHSIKEGRLKEIVDPILRGRILPKCLKEFARLAERCLHSHPKQRPTMAEVVVSLESILALQERTNNSMHPAGITIFGRTLPVFRLPSNGENFELLGEDTSSESLEFNFYTDGGELIELLQFEFDTLRVEFDTLRVATENFSEANKIGRGGIDFMYKGRLQNGQGIAVRLKRFYYDSLQILNECRNELSLLVKLENKNLVQLLGYCVEGKKLFLVYDFAIYASLDCLIFDPVLHTHLDWNKRYEIILGVARGLLYLHKFSPVRIVHCNVKPENVLLDESLDPRLSDFGLARSLAVDNTAQVDVAEITGTRRYMAPEYASKGLLSTKADVFSFGVLVLETIRGQRQSTDNFLHDTWTNWWKGASPNIIDPLIDTISSSFMTRYIQIGLLCVQEDAADRPGMDEVVEMLISRSFLTLPIPKMPSPSMENRSGFDDKDDSKMLDTAYDGKEGSDYDLGAKEGSDYDLGATSDFLTELDPR